MGEVGTAPFSVLPADEAPAYRATVFIDSENAFFWADDNPGRSEEKAPRQHQKRLEGLERLYGSVFGFSHRLDDDLSEAQLMSLGGPVFDALDEWATGDLGLGPHDLRSYGKGTDPATLALQGRADRRHYVHVKVSRDLDAADIALVKDLEDRARRVPDQRFVIVSSDAAKVLAWTAEIAKHAPQHRYEYVLGPTIFLGRGHPLPNVAYAGTVSEVFGRVVMGRKGVDQSGGPLVATNRDRGERRKKVRIMPSQLVEALVEAPTTAVLGDELVKRADFVGRTPSHWSADAETGVALWPSACLDAWAAWRHQHDLPDAPPCYADPDEVDRLFGQVATPIGAWVLREVVLPVLKQLPTEEREVRVQRLDKAYNDAWARLEPQGSHL